MQRIWRAGLRIAGPLAMVCGSLLGLGAVGTWAQTTSTAQPTIVAPPLGALVRDASTRMLVDQSSTRIMAIEGVRWSDSLLGCQSVSFPREQGDTPGFRVLIQAGRYALDYRTDDRRNRAVLCTVHITQPTPGAPRAEADGDASAMQPPPLEIVVGALPTPSS